MTESPGCRRQMILGSPSLVKDTVLVIPGSSRKIGRGDVDDPWGSRETREVLRRSRLLVAILLNLSSLRTFRYACSDLVF